LLIGRMLFKDDGVRLSDTVMLFCALFFYLLD